MLYYKFLQQLQKKLHINSCFCLIISAKTAKCKWVRRIMWHLARKRKKRQNHLFKLFKQHYVIFSREKKRDKNSSLNGLNFCFPPPGSCNSIFSKSGLFGLGFFVCLILFPETYMQV